MESPEKEGRETGGMTGGALHVGKPLLLLHGGGDAGRPPRFSFLLLFFCILHACGFACGLGVVGSLIMGIIVIWEIEEWAKGHRTFPQQWGFRWKG